ncbi:YraN family protein [Demequina globuliformis]|uniref:YraN family protein n=1 Tax=Demequina globuliformis TaxID=676202 RepID=UPI000780D7EC|nr:YraN family protein [Demequina globuliformis]
MTTAQQVGRIGEDAAYEWMVDRGWRVLARNWRCEHGEIDLVGVEDDTLVIAEVKARRSGATGLPQEAVTPRKLARLRRLAGAWLGASGRHWSQVRIDVFAVRVGPDASVNVEHLRGVE